MRRAAVAAALILGALAAPASAHVEVLPSQLVLRQSGELTIRVPTEGAVPTVSVRVTVPTQVTVYSLGPPPPGWTGRAIADGSGRFRTLLWTGGSIPPEHYADFTVLGTPFTTGTAVWKVLQGFSDGTTKPWVGTPEAPGTESPETGPTQPGPAAAQTISASAPAAPATGGASGGSGSGDDSGAGVWLGVVAIGISLLAVLATGFLWSTRPAKLPPDEEDDA